ncbi:MAG TPA: hypothetical protein VLV16_07465 [Gemmatimonadales bacterium]|nr:hypothetical protein [Gemmatimonadales bacterium]
MYAGHLGIALGARGLRRDAPLWLLVVATQACDWVQVVGCVTAPDASAMVSHSIPAVLVLATLFGLAAFGWTRSRGATAVIAATVVSHALADYLTGYKPTWPGGPMIGLSLYDYPALDLLVETLVVFVGWSVYRRSLDSRARSRRLTWFLLVLLVGVQLVGIVKMAVFPSPKCS